MDRQVFVFLPALDGADILAQERSNLLPGVEPLSSGDFPRRRIIHD
jgi:hypothetical protein